MATSRGDAAAATWMLRGCSVATSRGDAAAATWIFRGDKLLRYPPAYCRFELRTLRQTWHLAVPPEDVGRKRRWLADLVAQGGLALVEGGRAAVRQAAAAAVEDDAGE